MQICRLLPLALACLLFVSACKKDDKNDNNNSNETAGEMVAVMSVQSRAAELYAAVLDSTSGDSLEAMNAAAQWIIDQPEVDRAYFWSTGLLEVIFKNGLRSHLVIVSVDGNGQVLTRGSGGSGNALTRFGNAAKVEEASTIKIPNTNVLILNAFMDAMYLGGYQKDQMFPDTFDVDVYNDDAVTYDLLSKLDDDYGFIILNTHGLPNGFFLKQGLTLRQDFWKNNMTDAEIEVAKKEIIDSISTQMNIPLEKFANGETEYSLIALMDGYHISHKWALVSITDKWIRNSSLSFDQSILYGNHCWSGYTKDGATVKNLSEAWKSKGVAVYYGYAQDDGHSGYVLNNFAKRWEDTLIVNLLRGDSTGIAHLAADDTLMSHTVQVEIAPELVTRGIQIGAAPIKPLYFTHFFDERYVYFTCGDTLIDERDQQKYPTVCIGNQIWMAKNLNWAGAGVCYENSPSHCNTYGRLYQWSEATNDSTSSANPSGIRGICPKGWHLPSMAEWNELITFAGGPTVAGPKLKNASGLWTEDTGNTNDYGFNLVPAGECSTDQFSQEYDCYNEDVDAALWTTTMESGMPKYLAVSGGNSITELYANLGDEPYYSCRCVKNK